MANTAPQIQYRQEYIQGFEQRQSLLRMSVTREAVIKGNQAIFLVADSGAATTTTRGVNGDIPARHDNLSQITCTLTEQHDLVRKTGFNIFQSQGDQRRIMQVESMGVVNREMDSEILTALSAASVTLTATTADLAFVMHAKTKLGNAEVPFDGRIWAIISPAFEAYLMQVKEFASADYVGRKPMQGADAAWSDNPGFYRWLGVNWIVHPNVAGVGTANETCFMYHTTAIGHAVSTAEIQAEIGYDREQDRSWARHTLYHGAKLIQNSGVVVMPHDGSAYA